MGVTVRVGRSKVRFDGDRWSPLIGKGADAVAKHFQQVTESMSFESLPWDPAGVEHVREILADYGGEIVEIEPIDESDAVPGRVY